MCNSGQRVLTTKQKHGELGRDNNLVVCIGYIHLLFF
jgi:hypothetical protein